MLSLDLKLLEVAKLALFKKGKAMKIAEISARIGIRISTIRYYEKTGLCPPISRGSDGMRRFTPLDLEWFTLLASLRETGMPTSEMRAFARFYRDGNVTVSERKAMLCTHQQRLEHRRAQLDRCHDILSHKLAKYDEIIGEQT